MTTTLPATTSTLTRSARGSSRRLARLGGARRAHAAGAARLGRQHRAELRAAADRPRPRADRDPAALDHRRLPARPREPARHDGHARRSVRTATDAAHRRHRLRHRLGARRLRPERRVADRRARVDGRVRRDADAVDPVAAAQHLHATATSAAWRSRCGRPASRPARHSGPSSAGSCSSTSRGDRCS